MWQEIAISWLSQLREWPEAPHIRAFSPTIVSFDTCLPACVGATACSRSDILSPMTAVSAERSSKLRGSNPDSPLERASRPHPFRTNARGYPVLHAHACTHAHICHAHAHLSRAGICHTPASVTHISVTHTSVTHTSVMHTSVTHAHICHAHICHAHICDSHTHLSRTHL